MGTQNEPEVSTNQHKFSRSVEQSYMSCDMVKQMIQRWVTNGKPTFMVPKDFKDRIVTSGME